MCLNKLFPSKRLIIQHSTFSFNGASYIIRTFHVIDKSLALPKQTRSPYTALKLTIKSRWLDLHPAECSFNISLNHRRPLPVTRVIYNIRTNDLTSPLYVKHVWRPCDRLPGAVVSGKTQQSSFGVTHSRARRFYECLRRSKTKRLILRHPVLWTAGVNCGHAVCAGFQESRSRTHAQTRRFLCVFSLRMTKNWKCKLQLHVYVGNWGFGTFNSSYLSSVWRTPHHSQRIILRGSDEPLSQVNIAAFTMNWLLKSANIHIVRR